MPDTILLLDALYLIRRANIKFGVKPGDEDKQSYHIVYNLFRSLRVLVEELKPTRVFFCCESEHSFRRQIFSEYKANRILKTGGKGKTKESEEDFYRQADIVFKLLKYLPIVQVKADGYEADDIIATLAYDLQDEEVIIVSADKDFAQLLQKGYKHLRIYNPQKKDFVETPDYHVLTFLCTHGDTCDNVPRLMGKKKALECATNPIMLTEWLSATEENRANYKLNRQLVELKPIDDDKIEFGTYDVNYEALKEEFDWMEFDSIVNGDYWGRFVGTFEGLR
jgi:5'-3' exonuclease